MRHLNRSFLLTYSAGTQSVEVTASDATSL